MRGLAKGRGVENPPKGSCGTWLLQAALIPGPDPACLLLLLPLPSEEVLTPLPRGSRETEFAKTAPALIGKPRAPGSKGKS